MEFRLQRISYVWLFAAIISSIAALYLGYRFISTRNGLLFKAQENARSETKHAANELNQFIMMLKPIAQGIADTISSKNLNKEEIIALLKKTKPNDITGLGVAFIPHAIDPDTKLFSPYYVESEGKDKLVSLTDYYDYTAPEIPWFYSTMKNGARFLEPYYGEATQSILVEYVVPIYHTNKHGKKEAIGIAYANQSVEHLNHILDTLFLDQTGYWAVLSKKGTYLAHPQEQLINKQITIFDIAKKLDDPGLAKVAEQISEHKPVFYEYDNEITGAPSWLISQPLEGTDWSIVGVFDKSELDINPKILRQRIIDPSGAVLLLIIFLTLFLVTIIKYDHVARWWLASGIIAAALAGQVIWTWYASYSYPEFYDTSLYVVKNKSDLYDYLKKETAIYRYGKKIEPKKALEQSSTHATAQKEEALLHGYKNPRYIPTGIFVNNVHFLGANQIQVNAYVWQRFIDGVHDLVPRGITFPQSSETKLTELSRIKEGDREAILWEAHVKLDQSLYFHKYPFDTKALQIQLWYKYTKKNIVLIPDLKAYQLINPRSLPGIDNDVYMPGWEIVSSNFGYKKVNYTSNFGSYSIGQFGKYSEADKSEVPELFFDIFIRRHLIDTLISDLLPIAVIAVFLFVILLTSTQQKLGIIGSMASVFFATIFAQIRFRSKIPAAQVVYFETFFFVLYAMLLVILIITMAHYLKIHIKWIQYKDNLIAKLLYWPILCSIIAAVTLWYLY